MEKQEETQTKPVHLDRLAPEDAAAFIETGREMQAGIIQARSALNKYGGLLLSPEGEKVYGATDIQTIIGLFLIYSLEGRETQDIPGSISEQLQSSENDIKRILRLLGLA